MVAAGCRSRILKQISGPNGLWNLVHQFCIIFRDLSTRRDTQIQANRARPGDIGQYGDNRSDENEDSRGSSGHGTVGLLHIVGQDQYSWPYSSPSSVGHLLLGLLKSDAFLIPFRSLHRSLNHSHKSMNIYGALSLSTIHTRLQQFQKMAKTTKKAINWA